MEKYELEGEYLVVAATLCNNNHSIQTSTMIDTGTMGFAFIDKNFVCQYNLPRYTLNPPRDLKVIDRQLIESSQITYITTVCCQIQDHTETLSASITKIYQQYWKG